MGRARSAIAARTSIQVLQKALLDAFSMKETTQESHDDFFDAVNFCRDNSEEFNGEDGQEGWYFWQAGEWAIAGDISLRLSRSQDRLEVISRSVGELVAAGVDSSFQYAFFARFEQGETKRLLLLEDDEIVEEGFPISAERGQFIDDFDEDEAERLWISFGLPTFEHDPIEGPFACVGSQSQ